MGRTLTDRARGYLTTFEDMTGASVTDCVVLDERVVIVVDPGEMGAAIGPDGAHVRAVESAIDTEVKVIEGADDPARFVANALAPAAVEHVLVSTQGGVTVAYVEVAAADRGVAIGRGGRTIGLARTLAARHHAIDDVQLA
ncbi:MAG: NusA-like transcription termination signal-binding factor [Haloquadratum sp.]|jgi:N utilization substance protein A|nr:NusA-like transcription termination signal-binding factor [Haloferacaceae archaeon]MDR9445516.1 NusA-like transcription termination signal-binding factor [Haloquadratum sp.]